MSESENQIAEDLSLDGSEAELVVGGRSEMQAEMHRLESQGYIEEACTTKGTLMFNPKTKKHKMVKYA